MEHWEVASQKTVVRRVVPPAGSGGWPPSRTPSPTSAGPGTVSSGSSSRPVSTVTIHYQFVTISLSLRNCNHFVVTVTLLSVKNYKATFIKM